MDYFESINPSVRGEEIVELKQFTDNNFVPSVPYTGSKHIEMKEWTDFDSFKLIIEQSEPLLRHITAVVMEQNINER
ncbi:hypothetical protein B1201_16435 [Acinetobacter sp. ANC 5600]|nr:hypothetical protein B1201_16435 [Acinetobacter sp. ANC 5600]